MFIFSLLFFYFHGRYRFFHSLHNFSFNFLTKLDTQWRVKSSSNPSGQTLFVVRRSGSRPNIFLTCYSMTVKRCVCLFIFFEVEFNCTMTNYIFLLIIILFILPPCLVYEFDWLDHWCDWYRIVWYWHEISTQARGESHNWIALHVHNFYCWLNML